MAELFQTPFEILDACIQSVPESLTLEFKRKEDSASPLLSKADRRNISKSVAAFANSEGGILIYGVATNSVDGLDAASAADPIEDLTAFRNQFEAVCIENISPPVPGLGIETIALNASDDAGVLVCRVPRSLSRPHMSTAAGENRFYRRSFIGNLLMTPGEIKDQVLAVRDAILEPVILVAEGGSFSKDGSLISAHIPIGFRLKNVGRALCRNPFFRAKATCPLYGHSTVFDHALEAWKTDFPDGTFIHVEDQRTCFSLYLNAYVRLDLLGLRFEQNLPDLTETVLILPGTADYHAGSAFSEPSLEEIEFTLRFGAENAAATGSQVVISRLELAKKILLQQHVQDMAVYTLGTFRSDLVRQFAET